ncbi:Molybdopterin molybdenumtransferase [compost metagenome]
MISVKEAKQLINDHTTALEPLKTEVKNACGHILAANVYGICNIPLFRQSSMDGFALKFEDQKKELQLIGEMAAGTTSELTIKNSETCRIFTGAPIPIGADTVVMQEKTKLVNRTVLLNDPSLKLGANIRDIGTEIKTGALAMSEGDLLSPAAIGFLSGIGITEVLTYPIPKIAIIVTGNELQQPGKALNFGQVYESNSYALIAALRQEGINETSIFYTDDHLETLTDTLKNTLNLADMILLTGGVSVGDYDFVVEASKNCGIEQIFHKVKQKPGKPLFFGKKGRQVIFGLPGNPSSVLSCYYNYVYPCIKLLSNNKDSITQIQATLTHTYTKPSGLSHFLKGFYNDGKVSALSAQESFRLSSFAQANCLICLTEEQENILSGSTVKIILLPQ